MGFISATGIAFVAPIKASALSLLALTPLPAAAPAPVPVAGASLEVEFTNLRSNKGLLQICLTTDPKQFPDCKGDPKNALRRTISATNPHIRFEGLSPGTYAIGVIHDANSNAKLDTALGIPREGFGFSRDAPVSFGPPKFTSAAFTVGTEPVRQRIKLRYLL